MAGRTLLSLTVHPDEGDSYRVDVNSRLLLAWERMHEGSSLSVLEDASIAGMYQLAHFAARTRHGYTGTLADFEAGNDIEPEAEGEDGVALRPTDAAPSTEPPSNSPSAPAPTPGPGSTTPAS